MEEGVLGSKKVDQKAYHDCITLLRILEKIYTRVLERTVCMAVMQCSSM